jgi:hypothetical protein
MRPLAVTLAVALMAPGVAAAKQAAVPTWQQSLAGAWDTSFRVVYSSCPGVAIDDVEAGQLTFSAGAASYTNAAKLTEQYGTVARAGQIDLKLTATTRPAVSSGQLGMQLWAAGPDDLQGRRVLSGKTKLGESCSVVSDVSAGRMDIEAMPIGIAECDLLIDRFLRCAVQLPVENQKSMRDAARAMRKGYRSAAQHVEVHRHLADACRQSDDSMKTSMSSVCKWGP